MTFYEQWRSKQKDAIQPYIYTASILMGKKRKLKTTLYSVPPYKTSGTAVHCPSIQKNTFLTNM